VRIFTAFFALSLLLPGGAMTRVQAAEEPTADWQKSLTPLSAGKFAEMPEGEASYRFGWSGITAAEAVLKFSHPAATPGVSRLDAEVQTVGAARALWRLDAKALFLADTASTKPLRVRQLEQYRGRTVASALEFAPDHVFHSKGRLAHASDRPAPEFFSGAPADREAMRAFTGQKARRFKAAEVLDMQSALLFVRSQPLAPGDVLRFLVFQDNAAYLAVVRVAGREKITVPAGTYPAIKLDLSLKWVDDKLTLRPHANFKRASGWISDDKNRLLLKVESDVFIGSIWGELTKFTKRTGKPSGQVPGGFVSCGG